MLSCCRYVSKKDVDANVVYVSRAYYDEDKQRNAFQCSGFNWISSDRPREGMPLFCKVRHGPSMYRCAGNPMTHHEIPEAQQQACVIASWRCVCLMCESTCTSAAQHAAPSAGKLRCSDCRCKVDMLDADAAQITLEGNDQGLAAGQYVCLYHDECCLGSAVIRGSVQQL